MTVRYCPVCNRSFCVENSTDNYEHNCGETANVGSALSNERVMVIGKWEDYTGSGTTSMGDSASYYAYGGNDAKNWGTRSFIEGQRIHQLIQGSDKRQSTWRERKRITHIELGKGAEQQTERD